MKIEDLMAHMSALSQIGPRPSTSVKEREAADYVEKKLHRLGYTDIERQPFKSQNSAGWTTVPVFVMGLVGVALSLWLGMWGKLFGGLLMLLSAYLFRQSALVIPSFYEKFIQRWDSQNVIAKIAAKNQAKKTIYLVGHLDSQKQRFQFPSSPYWAMKAQTSLPIVLGGLGGVLLLGMAFTDSQSQVWWIWLLGSAYVWGLAGGIFDEIQPYVEGANDNATAVSLLLGAAEALKENPLNNTDVILLFTGCEEVGCVGMESYLDGYAPPKENTFWIDIEMVGTGDLCYVTKHGISYQTHYAPHPEMVEFAQKTADVHPDLNVTGKEMVMLEEVANLRRRGYKAICIAGYGENGMLPNWHRLSDELGNIEPDTLNRAANYVWALMRKIDGK